MFPLSHSYAMGKKGEAIVVKCLASTRSGPAAIGKRKGGWKTDATMIKITQFVKQRRSTLNMQKTFIYYKRHKT